MDIIKIISLDRDTEWKLRKGDSAGGKIYISLSSLVMVRTLCCEPAALNTHILVYLRLIVFFIGFRPWSHWSANKTVIGLIFAQVWRNIWNEML